MGPYVSPAIAALAISLLAAPAQGAAYVTVGEPEVTETPEGQRVVQTVTLANELAHYTLTYDVIHPPGKPDEVSSHWWQWQQEFISVGMTEPSKPNWYWQAFFNWYFDDESLHRRPAELRVVRESGQDGMIEYLWDTPKVRASVRFAVTTGSDKLLMFGSYEPKEPVERSRLKLSCYPATFAQPRERAVTTAKGTRRPGETIELDLAVRPPGDPQGRTVAERWVLYEDTMAGRPASGSAGMLIGTPQAFTSVTMPVGDYGIFTALELAPDQRSFALGLYDFPTLPDYQATREYFARSADAEAEAIGQMAAGDLDRPLPAMPMDEERLALLIATGDEMLNRPSEIWRPDEAPLQFPWAREIPGDPISTVVLCRRWCAWETMELARRLEMDAQHLYFDSRDTLSWPNAWPYRYATGIFPLPPGVAAPKAATLASDANVDLFLCAGTTGEAIPGVSRTAIVQQVEAGKGLLIAGNPGVLKGWPEALFETAASEIAEAVLACFDWEMIPGYREGERGRVEEQPPIKAYRYGQGRVVLLNVNLGTYSALVPRNDASEGLEGATDRCLALAACAALAAVDRLPALDAQKREPAAPQGSRLLVRVQDDLDRVVYSETTDLPLGEGEGFIPMLPTGRTLFMDRLVLDPQGQCLGLCSREIPDPGGPRISGLAIEPSSVTHEPAPPRVELPEGGEITCTATLEDAAALEGAQLQSEVRDAFDRVLARGTTPVDGTQASVRLSLNRPVTVCHVLEVVLKQGDTELSFARRRFTMGVPYPYDDFTVLMWTYAGGDPLLQRTDRMCYEQGADMCDLCHMGGYDDAGAAREYGVSARSGLRPVPYVTRMAGEANAEHHRAPCLHDPEYLEARRQSLTTTCRQAAPYSPAAYTLGDENYLFRGEGECCHRPESVEAFREWLRDKYGGIAALNAAWGTDYASFHDFERPMLLGEAVQQQVSFAPWIDHKLFMDSAFVQAHETFAGFVRAQDPGAKVGWDGFLGYTWRSGYDFAGLTRNLELNQTYTLRWLQGELVRSFKRPDALTGKWGNHVADNEAGWSAFPWDCLLAGDNSVWWWTSWGCDYIPFNPDLSLSNFGRWFFASAREATAGPGKLLLHATREHSGVAVLHSQRDLFAAAVVGQLVEEAAFAGDSQFLREHEALLKGMKDLGYQYRHLSYDDLEQGRLSADEYRVLILPLASCISDQQVAMLRQFVEAGGTLIVDGRAGLLTGDGLIRETRALDDILGVQGAAGLTGLKRAPVSAEVAIEGSLAGAVSAQPLQLEAFPVEVLEPGMKTTTGQALVEINGAPILVTNRLGGGRAITLNIAMTGLTAARVEGDTNPLLEILSAALGGAGVEPYCELRRADGSRPRCVQQILFTDGALRYLALQQDILLRDLTDQEAHVTLAAPTIAYDLRRGRRVGQGLVTEWDVTLSRGRPLVYSLLPYEVTEVTAEAPATGGPGATVAVKAGVSVSTGEPSYHVVRLDVYAPGSETPHRQYSQNIACPRGKGATDIPFALSDRTGEWRLELRDVASGVKTVRSLVLE